MSATSARHFSKAIANICGMTQAALLARSSDYATPPWGDEQQARFINACIEIETSLDPHALLFTLHKIENKFGRDRASETRWGPRTLDLDLIAYDDVSIEKPELTLPHPRLFERAFVLVPLAEIVPDRVIAGRSVSDGAGGSFRPTESSGCPTSTDQTGLESQNNRLAWRPPRGNFRPNQDGAQGSDLPEMTICTTDELRLAADFAPATYDDWRKLVDGVLKGAPFEKLVGKTYDGLKIEPIYPRAQGAAPVAGRPAAAPWQIMQRIDHPDAAAANAQALHDLENGANGLTLVFAGANGAHGFGLDPSAEAVEKILDGIFIDAGIGDRASDRSAVADGRDPCRRICQAQGPRSRGLRYPLRSRSARRLRGVGIQSLCLARDRARGDQRDQGPRRAWASRARSRPPTGG